MLKCAHKWHLIHLILNVLKYFPFLIVILDLIKKLFSHSQFVSFCFDITESKQRCPDDVLQAFHSPQSKTEDCHFNINWLELQLHAPWPNLCLSNDPTRVLSPSFSSYRTDYGGCSAGLRSQMADNYSSHCVSYTFCILSPPLASSLLIPASQPPSPPLIKAE